MAVPIRTLANAIRALAMDAVEAANSGHPGMPMGMADAATVLWTEFLKHDPADPHWPDRDRFVLSAGHGSMLIYALLHLTGYAHPTLDEIRHFRQLGSPCAGHPENFLLEGVEATTGPLGQGLAMAVGMAIAERHLNAQFGDALVDHRTWVIAGDGCLMEGVNHEAAGLAGHLGLGRLNVLWDDNRITIDGATSLSTSEDIEARYRAYGWHVVRCDGLDADDVRRTLDEAVADPRPSLIACRTIIGFGAPTKQGTAATHGAALGPDEVAAARRELGWDYPPFELPPDLVSTWHALGRAGAGGAWCVEWAPRRERPGGGVQPPHGWRPARRLLARRLYRRPDREPAEGRNAQGLRGGSRRDQRAPAGDAGRLGRSHRFEQHQNAGPETSDQRGLFRPLPLLRDPRVRHGRGDERHGAARRRDPLWRHLPGLRRLCPARHPPLGAAAGPDHLRDDPRFDRPRRGRADPPAGRASDEPEGDAQSRRLPAGRRGRDRGMLGTGARARRTGRPCWR